MSQNELLISGEQARTIIINAHALLRRKYRYTPLWALVSDLTSHGSGYSKEICRTAKLDPHQICGSAKLKDLSLCPAPEPAASAR